MSAPASAARLICSIVAAASSVGVLVMVCTAIGASPPISTDPTRILRDGLRSMDRQGLTGLWLMDTSDLASF